MTKSKTKLVVLDWLVILTNQKALGALKTPCGLCVRAGYSNMAIFSDKLQHGLNHFATCFAIFNLDFCHQSFQFSKAKVDFLSHLEDFYILILAINQLHETRNRIESKYNILR